MQIEKCPGHSVRSRRPAYREVACWYWCCAGGDKREEAGGESENASEQCVGSREP